MNRFFHKPDVMVLLPVCMDWHIIAFVVALVPHIASFGKAQYHLAVILDLSIRTFVTSQAAKYMPFGSFLILAIRFWAKPHN